MKQGTKLSADQRRHLELAVAAGTKVAALAAEFSVSEGYIYRLRALAGTPNRHYSREARP